MNSETRPSQISGVLPSKEEHGDVVTVRGQVLQPDGQPAADAQVTVLTEFRRNRRMQNAAARPGGPRVNRFSNPGGQGWFPIAVAQSDRNGQFEVSYRKSQFTEEMNDWKYADVAAQKSGFGLQWKSTFRTKPSERLVLKLVEDLPIHGRIVDLEGKPIARARLKLVNVNHNRDGDLQPWLDALKAGRDIGYTSQQIAWPLPHFAPNWNHQSLRTQTGVLPWRGSEPSALRDFG